ncbi:MAG: hypothetical protein IKV57_07290 [Clostridia bacterium]|nr:hypothetical protein [Clostridia bacterium]
MKRLICLFLALLTTMSMAACGDAEPVETESAAQTETEAEGATETQTETEEETMPPLSVPADLDYDGYEAHIYSFQHSGYHWEHVAEELTGEVLNDAIYNRNLSTSDLLNVKITAVINKWDNDNFRYMVRTSAMSGDDAYDIYTGNTYNSTYLSANGYYYDVTKMPYIDPLNSPWWNKSAYEELSIGDKAFLLMGDICASNYSLEAVFFNKDLIVDNDMDDPYTMVDEDRWLLDNMISMTKDFYQDLDGDGVRDEDGDMYGIYGASHSVCNMAYYYLKIVEKTEDNYIKVNFGSERNEEILTKLKDWFTASDGFLYQSDGWTDMAPFAEYENCIFIMQSLQRCVALRDYDINYGIVPIPKYDELQEDFTAVGTGLVVSFPVSATNIERSAAIADTLGYYGRLYVLPAYVDNTLMYKGTRDEDAARMIEIILDSVFYDFGKEYSSFTGWSCAMLDFQRSNQGFASFYEARNQSADKELYDVADKILALEQ